MDDEFKLCWKNFQDNIASGFQSLYDRGDLVDVTLACDGKLLQAHKIVLAICSPYFQEIFISNPCKHPIIILKDVSYNIMCELLEFMYQGVVNVKHTELQAFMKIGQLLQIKGLATNSSSSAASTSSEKSSNNNQTTVMNDESSFTPKQSVSSAIETVSNEENSNIGGEKPSDSNSKPNTPHRSQSPVLSPAASPINNNSLNSGTINQVNKSGDSHLSLQQPPNHGSSSISGVKRHPDYSTDSLSIYSRNKHRRSITSTDHSSENTDGPDGGSVSGAMEQMNTEDFFLPHISMVESRYELNNIKRENADHHQNTGVPSAAAVAAASASLRNSFNTAAFGLDYTFYKNNSASSQPGQEYPNELHMSNEYSKSFANHMDIPPNCPNVVMLSSTSLLHGNCVFNRNNTVATQQGMKTYWLCKSYRISMCRARCITHQGKIISATGVHNHPPHMRGNSISGCSSGSNGGGSSGNTGANNINNAVPAASPHTGNTSGVGAPPTTSSSGSLGLRFPPNSGPSGNINQQSYHEHHHTTTSPSQAPHPPTFASNQHLHSVGPGEHWYQGKLEFMLSQRGKPLLVHDGHTFGIQYVRKDKKYWQCNLSRKFNCKARVTTTDTGEIIVTNNEHCHTEIRQHLRKDYQRNKVMMNALINLSTNRLAVENFRRHNSIANNLSNLQSIVAAAASTPLSLQSHIDGANPTTGHLLDLGKRSTSAMDIDNHLKHTQTHHYEHRIHNPMNKAEEDDSRDEPLDCGIRSSSFQNERESVNILNDNNSNNPNTSQSTIHTENRNDWLCKNEEI